VTTADNVSQLEEVGFDKAQAVAIVSVIESKSVTRDYLDAKIEALFNRILIAALAIAGISIALTTALGRIF
jgi:hypothetical protein